MKQYGLPYMGSKSKIIEKIAKYFPKADNFYDLFGGGFSVSHYMAEKGDYKNVYYNELEAPTVKLVDDCLAGKYKDFVPEWIDCKTFNKLKATDAYVAIVWSFGNNRKRYLYSGKNEIIKKAIHQAIVFNEFSAGFKHLFGMSNWPANLKTIREKRLYLKSKTGKSSELENLARLQSIESIERLERLGRLGRLEGDTIVTTSCSSYDQVEIKPNSVIYCDIPYKGTEDYGNSFNHNAFYKWAIAQSEPVFISEYEVNHPLLPLIAEFEHRSTLSASSNSTKSFERLYGNAAAIKAVRG